MTDYTVKIKACLYELQESPEYLPENFKTLYQLHKCLHGIGEGSSTADLWDFASAMCRSYKQVKKYYDLLCELIKQDPVLEPICDNFLNFLEQHYGRNSIHKVEYHSQDRNSIRLALQKLISDVDTWKIGKATKREIVYTFFDLAFDEAGQFAGRNEAHYFKSRESKYTPSYFYHQWQHERRLGLFRCAVADDELRPMVEQLIKLIDERNMNLGSESDLRYISDQELLFEAPYQALLEHSDRYIADFVDSYSLTYRWYNHLPENATVSYLLEAHPQSTYLKYFYPATGYRLSGNDKECPPFTPWFSEQVKSPEFIEELLLICATDAIRSAQVCHSSESYSSLDELRSDESFVEDLLDLAEDLEEKEEGWGGYHSEDGAIHFFEEDFFHHLAVQMIGGEVNQDNLEALCAEIYKLKVRVGKNMRGILAGHLEPAFEPCYGYKSCRESRDESERKRQTEPLFALHNINEFCCVTYEGNEYLLGQEDDNVYIYDLAKMTPVSFRPFEEDSLYQAIFAARPTPESPAHFVTFNMQKGLVEAWHFGQTAPVYTLRANAFERCIDSQLSDDGRVLLMGVGNEIDSDSEINPDVLELVVDHKNMIVVIDLEKGKELCRFEVNERAALRMSGDGSVALMCQGGSRDRGDIFTRIDLRTGVAESLTVPSQFHLGSDEFAINHDGSRIIYKQQLIDIDLGQVLLTLPGDEFVSRYEFVGDDKFVIAHLFSETEKELYELETARRLGTIYCEEGPSLYQSFVDHEKGILYSFVDYSVNFYDIGEMLGLERDPLVAPEFQNATVWDKPFGPKVKRREGSFSTKEHGIELKLVSYGCQSEGGRFVRPQGIAESSRALGCSFDVNCDGMGRVFGFVVKLTHPMIDGTTQTEWQVIGKRNRPLQITDPFTAEQRVPGRYVFEVYSLDETLLFSRQVIDLECYKAVDCSVEAVKYGSFFGDTHVANKKAAVNYDYCSIGYHLRVDCGGEQAVVALKSRIYRADEVPSNDDLLFKPFELARSINVSDGSIVDLTIRGDDSNGYIEGKWVFELADANSGNVLFSDTIEIYPKDKNFEECKVLRVEMIDHGIYQPPEGFDLTQRHLAEARELVLLEQTSVVKPEAGILYGFRFVISDESPDAVYRVTVEQWATGQKWVCADDGNARYKRYHFLAQKGETYLASWTIAEEFEVFHDMSRIILRHGPVASPMLHDFHAEKEVEA
ncbi:hypothetical protein ABT56_02660 [Photobacterium aquae]|uniref:Uncharacterized protein n=1 Tax=Photobacterium aquae TaxID=1195763 RepID=A0A0J1HBS4_9GAMM|nr:hypothetical protein [Photobacterium aquae]KLV09114.1 hypothetical protein ABT56_02660 [Photobacterium aquae]